MSMVQQSVRHNRKQGQKRRKSGDDFRPAQTTNLVTPHIQAMDWRLSLCLTFFGCALADAAILAGADLPIALAPVAPGIVLVGPRVEPALAEHAVLGNSPPGGAPRYGPLFLLVFHFT